MRACLNIYNVQLPGKRLDRPEEQNGLFASRLAPEATNQGQSRPAATPAVAARVGHAAGIVRPSRLICSDHLLVHRLQRFELLAASLLLSLILV